MEKCQLATSNAKRTLLELVFILSVTMTDSCTTFSFQALEIAVCCYASNSVRRQHCYASNSVRQRCWYQGHCYLNLNCGRILFHVLKKKKEHVIQCSSSQTPTHLAASSRATKHHSWFSLLMIIVLPMTDTFHTRQSCFSKILMHQIQCSCWKLNKMGTQERCLFIQWHEARQKNSRPLVTWFHHLTAPW